MAKIPQRLWRHRLYNEFKTFTHGGQYWQDSYLLEDWSRSLRPVVYRGDVYNVYTLLRRLGNWCWMARDATTQEYLTIKFLPRHDITELKMSKLISRCCDSPFVSRVRDHFVVAHHLAKQDPEYEDMHFNAIVYPMTGTDLQRISIEGGHLESRQLPLSMERREQCVQQIIQGVAELHKIGVVHGDIHPGNVALPPPPHAELQRLLAKEPLEDRIRRKDGQPTSSLLPYQVIEPEDFGFGEGPCKVLDFGYAFKPMGMSYISEHFSQAMPPPPELSHGMGTTYPFKADSWNMGQLIYFILTDGCLLLGRGYSGEELQRDCRDRITELKTGKDEAFNELPEDIQRHFLPFILGLLHADPTQRLSIHDIRQGVLKRRQVTCVPLLIDL